MPEIQKAPHVENDGRQIETTGAAISAELKRTWKMNNDSVSPDETETYYLAEDVKLYGEEKVRQTIIRAGQKKRSTLTIYRNEAVSKIYTDIANKAEAEADKIFERSMYFLTAIWLKHTASTLPRRI